MSETLNPTKQQTEQAWIFQPVAPALPDQLIDATLELGFDTLKRWVKQLPADLVPDDLKTLLDTVHYLAVIRGPLHTRDTNHALLDEYSRLVCAAAALGAVFPYPDGWQ